MPSQRKKKAYSFKGISFLAQLVNKYSILSSLLPSLGLFLLDFSFKKPLTECKIVLLKR